eukprot:1853512-Prymnesium_polylepis.4
MSSPHPSPISTAMRAPIQEALVPRGTWTVAHRVSAGSSAESALHNDEAMAAPPPSYSIALSSDHRCQHGNCGACTAQAAVQRLCDLTERSARLAAVVGRVVSVAEQHGVHDVCRPCLKQQGAKFAPSVGMGTTHHLNSLAELLGEAIKQRRRRKQQGAQAARGLSSRRLRRRRRLRHPGGNDEKVGERKLRGTVEGEVQGGASARIFAAQEVASKGTAHDLA